MTYSPGDPGHMLAHSDLVTAVNAELTRFGMAADLPTRALGDEGHLDDHNAIRGALATIEATAGRTFGTALPPVRNLGDPGHVDDHTALLACALEASLWPAWNDGTGGTVTEIDDYNGATGERWRVHQFDSDGVLDVSLAIKPFRVLVSGGGGGGNPDGQLDSGGVFVGTAHGGGGGVHTNDTATLPTGPIALTVGAGGGSRGRGGNTTFRDVVAEGGYGGSGTAGGASGAVTVNAAQEWPSHAGRSAPSQQFGTAGGSRGPATTAPGPGAVSDISGASVEYGRGGPGGPGSGGGSRTAPSPAPGQDGVVIVAYRIG